jgi:hypothetical protein
MLNLSKSFRDFLRHSDSRIAEFILRAEQYEYWNYHAYRLMITDSEINYLTLRGDGTISYLPKGKPHLLTDDGQWAREGRQNGAAGKTIKKILTKRAQKLFRDSEYESFVNQYKSACDAENKEFVIRPNVDIPDVYCMKRERGGGTLEDSCMNGDKDYLDLYKCCPKLRILTLVNGCGELGGRALVWDIGNGEFLMDRIYVAQDHYYDMFLAYAFSNGWLRKVEYKTYRDKEYLTKDGVTNFYRQITIDTPTTFEAYPYIDTFSYGGDGFLKNYCSGTQYEYCQTGGTREGDDDDEDDDEDYFYCEHSGNRYHEDYSRYIERGRYSGCYIHEDYTVYCETDGHTYYENDDNIVEVGDNWYREDDDDICYVDDDGDWHMREDCCWSDFHDEYILEGDCSFSEHHDTYIKNSEAYMVADKVYHESVVSKID